MFNVRFTEDALDDLRILRKTEQILIFNSVEKQLLVEPLVETRNRKALRPNELSKWELRIDRFRLFYDVDEQTQEVTIKAVGWKDHNILYIRGKEFRL